jgi:biopolymer transport protein ExbD
MGMSVGSASGSDEPMVEMNTTPLIDVMLVLLVMIIVTIPVQKQAVKLDMPRPSANKPTAPPEVVELEVDFDGTILWNGNVVPDQDQMIRYLASSAAASPQPEIHLRPNRLAKYDTVAKILAVAQRLGVKRIGFVGNEQFLQD